ncbi:MAG: phage minor head protein [Pseudomonadota bacterium]
MAEDDRIAAVFKRPFPQQVAAWRLRMAELIPTMRWTDVWQAGHDRGFMVAGALKADLLADLAEAVRRSIEEGRSLEEFRRDFRALVEKNGWHGWTGEGTKAGEAWRTRVIYRTNARTSFMAGRFAQLTEAGFPYWVYRHGGSLHPREHHLELDGLILPSDHPFWQVWFPPNGWGCSCRVVGARSIEGARRVGGNPNVALPDNWQAPNPKTGAPEGIDKGWAYAPGASVADEITTLVEAKRDVLPDALGEAFARAIAERLGQGE